MTMFLTLKKENNNDKNALSKWKNAKNALNNVHNNKLHLMFNSLTITEQSKFKINNFQKLLLQGLFYYQLG